MTLASVEEIRDSRRWGALALVLAAQFMVILDVAIVNVALPSIKTDLGFSQRSIALGIWGAASGSGAAAGVLLGGLLTSYLNWSWIFFINVPVGVTAVALTPWLLRESRAEVAHRHFDLAGAAAVTGGLMLLVYAMTRAPENGWTSGTTIGLLLASVLLIVVFVTIELRTRVPLLPMRIFRMRTLAAANATAVVVAAVA